MIDVPKPPPSDTALPRDVMFPQELPRGYDPRLKVRAAEAKLKLEDFDVVDTLTKILNQAPPAQRKRIAAKAMRQFREDGKLDLDLPGGHHLKMDVPKRAAVKIEDHLQAHAEAQAELVAWCRAKPALERLDSSAWHKAVAALRSNEMHIPVVGGDVPDVYRRSIDVSPQVFVVAHDWAAAFAGAGDFEGGEWRLPYEHSVFEFRIGGHRVAALVSQASDDVPLRQTQCIPCAGLDAGWVMPMIYKYDGAAWRPTRPHWLGETFQPVMDMIGAQVRAIAIALEAEVATTELIRAPHRLNVAREKRGALPIADYHVIRLDRRRRLAPLPDDGNDRERRRGVRLHFRRGHWRHYANHKTWIEWMLVGNPDLGFIDKEYRL